MVSKRIYIYISLSLRVNTDLDGVDGFIEITNIECYTLTSTPPQFFMQSGLVNEFFEEVPCYNGGIQPKFPWHFWSGTIKLQFVWCLIIHS